MADKAALCKDCAMYKHFKDKCWYYWDHKSACTQFKKTDLDEPSFVELKE